MTGILMSAFVLSLSGCVEKRSGIGQSLAQLSTQKNVTALSKREVTLLLQGKTIKGESEKTIAMRGFFTQKFLSDGEWVFTFHKTMSQAPKHSYYGKWWILDDGSLCTQKEGSDKSHCNRKLYKSANNYYTVNTETGKVWAEWSISKN